MMGGNILAMPKAKGAKRDRQPHFIKEWRLHRNLTQEQAADRIGMSQGNYAKIEGNRVPYNQDFLELAAHAFRCEPADLIMRDPSSEIWSIYDTLKALPAPERETVEKMVKSLKRAS